MNSYFEGMKAIVSERGQVTIPKGVRDRLGIRPGQALDFEAEDGRLVARKILAVDPVDAAFGILKGLPSTDEIIRSLRGDPDAV